ncbi:Leucine carboxyl methyltransferase 2 [Chamberlinius hualienensis]
MPFNSKPSSAVAVQTTNDSSILSKHSMIAAEYFCDPFIGEFVNKFSPKRTSLINRGYYVRAKAVDYAISKWLLNCRQNYPSHYQIVSLGAGFDTLFFRLNFADVKVFEVDYYDVVSRKALLIKSSSKLKSLLPSDAIFAQDKDDCVVMDSTRYAMIGTDLKNLIKLETLFELCHLHYDLPTLLLSECAITYMREVDSTKLIKWSSGRFKNGTFVTYEQITPTDGFGQVMVNHFQNTGSPLLSVGIYPTLQQQQQRYIDAGWSTCKVVDMNTFYQTVLTPIDRLKVNQLELFEEYEEFHQKCSHYVLITASHQQEQPLSLIEITDTKVCHVTMEENLVHTKRFGHRSVILNEQFVLIVGGFGPSDDGHHKRLSNIDVIDVKSWKNGCISSSCSFFKRGLMYHSLTVVNNHTVLVFGGRTSPSTAFNDVYTIKLHEINSDLAWQPIFTKLNTTGTGPSPRWRHSATLVLIDGKQKLIVFGGKSITECALSDCFCLDISTMIWTPVKADSNTFTPPASHSHSSCCWNDCVVISGGLSNTVVPSHNVYILNCLTFKWNLLQTIGLKPRYSHTSHVLRNKLYLIGGVNSFLNAPGIAVVDLVTGQCNEFPLPVFPQPVLLFKHSSELLAEEESILILGGGGNCFSFGTHFNKLTLKIKLKELKC